MNPSTDQKYGEFCSLLKKYKNQGDIKLLHRGESKIHAFSSLRLDPLHDTIEQFANALYFFGSKSKYFWNEKLSSDESFDFDLNEVSEEFFKYIFLDLLHVSKYGKKAGTIRYLAQNKDTRIFFSNESNLKFFIEMVSKLSQPDKFFVRNYYLRILHQLGESKYKKKSQFISSSTSEQEATKFSNNEIIIYFWDINFGKRVIPYNIPIFKGKPYKNQKEISIFSAIFPHFIYAFKYGRAIYPNPAISKSSNLELAVLTGLEIVQTNFITKLTTETNYGKGVVHQNGAYSEIK